MGKLLGFLIYMTLAGLVAWHLVRLLNDPAARTLARIAFVLGVGGVLLAMLVIGVTQ
jgi:hypothetical protein